MGLEEILAQLTGLTNAFLPWFGWNEFTVQLIAAIVKFAIIFVIILQIPPVMVWIERRAPAMMQRRKGPNRVGVGKWRLYGLLQSAADAIKLIFKEEIVPTGSNRKFFQIAPILGLFPALLIALAIPFGNDIEVFGYTIALSVIDLDVGYLFILALSSLAVYGVTIAGWASNNKYSLMGALRASAQMISYEIPLGLSLIPIVIIYGSLNLNEIILGQSTLFQWGIFTAPFSFVIFLICMFAETNRAPFDLAEAESELVAGFHTEYGSAKFATIFLSEYVAMYILSCLAAVVFLGGWQIPFVSYEFLNDLLGSVLASLVGFVVLQIKAAFFMMLYVWVRWTLPRFRYDQLMALGWKFMLPISLANVFLTALWVAVIRF